MGFFSSLLTPSGPGINLASCPLGKGRKPSGKWNLIVQLHLLRRLRMCGIHPLRQHCRWKKLYLGLWIVFLTMEPDILVGVKLLRTVIVGGGGGLSSWGRDFKHTLNGLTPDTSYVWNVTRIRTFQYWYDYVKCHVFVAACRVSLVLMQEL